MPGRSARSPASRLPRVALLAAPALLAAAAVLARPAAYRSGPPPAHTGGFGEPTCHACHQDYEPNSGKGAIRLLGLEPGYTPGAARRITVELTSPGMLRAGFELAVRYAAGEAAGKQAGELRASGERVAVTTDSSGVQYAHHGAFGTDLAAPDTGRWMLEWTAPEDGGDVVFHVAANAGNDDDSPFGDFIFTHSVRLRAAQAGTR